MCYGRKSRTINISAPYEGSYFNSFSMANCFPVEFIDTPAVTLGCYQGSALVGCNMSSQATTGFGCYIWKQQAKNNVAVIVNYVAYGRWKN